MRKFIKITVVLANLFILMCLGIIVYFSKALPNNYYVAQGGELKISSFIEAVPCTGTYYGELYTAAGKTETKRAELKLLGIIPIKTVNIQGVNEPVLIPC